MIHLNNKVFSTFIQNTVNIRCETDTLAKIKVWRAKVLQPHFNNSQKHKNQFTVTVEHSSGYMQTNPICPFATDIYH